MQDRVQDPREHPLHGRHQVQQVQGQGRRGELRRRRQVASGKQQRPAVGCLSQPERHLFGLLVLEQAPHQRRAGIFPALLVRRPGQQHLHLESQQPAGHLQVVRRLVQPQVMDCLEELVGYPGDGDVGDVDLLLAEQVKQQVEGSAEGVQLDDECRLQVQHRGRGGRFRGQHR